VPTIATMSRTAIVPRMAALGLVLVLEGGADHTIGGAAVGSAGRLEMKALPWQEYGKLS